MASSLERFVTAVLNALTCFTRPVSSLARLTPAGMSDAGRVLLIPDPMVPTKAKDFQGLFIRCMDGLQTSRSIGRWVSYVSTFCINLAVRSCLVQKRLLNEELLIVRSFHSNTIQEATRVRVRPVSSLNAEQRGLCFLGYPSEAGCVIQFGCFLKASCAGLPRQLNNSFQWILRSKRMLAWGL